MMYKEDDINVFSWPEPIRKRPSMYYKHLGVEGCIWLINEILDSILDEKYQCKANTVDIRLTRHKEVIIEYDGKGPPIETTISGGIPEPILYKSMMGLFCGECSEEDFKKNGHLCYVGSVFNAACKVLRIYTLHEQKLYSLGFYQGCISSPLSESSINGTKNKLQFLLDSEVMGECELTELILKDIVERTQNKYQGAVVKYGS